MRQEKETDASFDIVPSTAQVAANMCNKPFSNNGQELNLGMHIIGNIACIESHTKHSFRY